MPTYDFTTENKDFPAGTVAVGYLLTLTETSTAAVLTGSAALGETQISVNEVPPGSYIASVALIDAAGVPLSTAVVATEQLVVVAPSTGGGGVDPNPTTVSLAVPVSLIAAAPAPAPAPIQPAV